MFHCPIDRKRRQPLSHERVTSSSLALTSRPYPAPSPVRSTPSILIHQPYTSHDHSLEKRARACSPLGLRQHASSLPTREPELHATLCQYIYIMQMGEYVSYRQQGIHTHTLFLFALTKTMRSQMTSQIAMSSHIACAGLRQACTPPSLPGGPTW